MMSGRFSDMAISLELSMGHTHMIYQLKAPISLYLMISYRCLTDLNQRKSEFKTYFPTYIFSSKISRLILYRFFSILDRDVDNIHMEGTVSQIFDEGLSFHFMLKNGKI